MISSAFSSLLGSLTIKVQGGGAEDSPQPAVLSCGGIFFPKRKVPVDLRTWRQIINLPGNESTAKIVGFFLPDPREELVSFLQKEGLN